MSAAVFFTLTYSTQIFLQSWLFNNGQLVIETVQLVNMETITLLLIRHGDM